MEHALLVSSPESPPPIVNWLMTITNSKKTFYVMNNNAFSEVRLQPEDIKSSVLIGQVGRKFVLVSLLSSRF